MLHMKVMQVGWRLLDVRQLLLREDFWIFRAELLAKMVEHGAASQQLLLGRRGRTRRGQQTCLHARWSGNIVQQPCLDLCKSVRIPTGPGLSQLRRHGHVVLFHSHQQQFQDVVRVLEGVVPQCQICGRARALKATVEDAIRHAFVRDELLHCVFPEQRC